MVIFPGQQNTVINLMPYLERTNHDYENPCSLDVLDIDENHKKGSGVRNDEFQKQLGRSLRGSMKYLLLKDGHPHLSNDKSVIWERLNNLMRNLSRKKHFETNNSIT